MSAYPCLLTRPSSVIRVTVKNGVRTFDYLRQLYLLKVDVSVDPKRFRIEQHYRQQILNVFV